MQLQRNPSRITRSAARTVRSLCWLAALGTGLFMLTTSCPAQEAQTNYYKLLLNYDFGTNSEVLAAIEDEARQAKPEQRGAIEDKLIGVLESAQATFPAKQFACRMLAIAGSPKCVPVAGKLLTDEKLSHAARIVLQAIQDKSADKVLLKSLGKTQGKLQIGIINTIGIRADEDAAGELADLLSSKDEGVVAASLNSLARIGNAKAAKALGNAKVPETLKAKLLEARLTCANKLCADGDGKLADAIYTDLMAAGNPDTARTAGFLGLVRVRKDKAMPMLMETLKSGDKVLVKAACPALMDMQGDGVGKTLAAELPSLPASGKVAVLNALMGRKDASGMGAVVNALVNDQSPEVKLAAARAAAKLGDASSVAVLASTLKTDDELSQAAAQSLRKLQGSGVVDELSKAASAGEPAIRAGVLAALSDRQETSALPAMYKAAEDQDGNVRSAAIRGIGLLAGKDDLPKLVDILIAQKDGGERNKLEQAIAGVGLRIDNADERTAAVIQGLSKAGDAAKCNLLGALSKMGGNKALEAVKPFLSSTTPDLKKAAVRALSEWVDQAPMNDVLDIAKNSAEDNLKIMALRGYIRLAGLKKDKPAKEKLAWYSQALELASRPDEKRNALGGVSEIHNLDALKLVEKYITDDKVKNEALSAYAKIAEKISGGKPAEAKAALQRVIDSTTDEGLRNRAKDALGKIAK